MLIWLLWILFVCLLVISYLAFKKEIANPAILLVATYTVSILCCCLNVSKWGVNLSLKAFLILLLGAIEFVGVTYLCKYFHEKKENNKNESLKFEPIKINKVLGLCILIFDLITIFLLINNVLSIASQFGEYNGLSSALTIYKENVDYNNNALLHPIIRILIKFVIAFGYISLFSFISSIMFDKRKNVKITKYICENIFNILCCISCALIYFFQSNRGSIISFAAAGFVMIVIMWSIRKCWSKTISIKKIGMAIGISFLGLVMFYFSAKLVGRINSKKMLDYITYYAGGSIECFNQFVSHDYQNSKVFGEQTFEHLINNLNNYGIIDTPKPQNISPFIYYNGEMVGNIYTAYHRWMYDFGIMGVIVLQGILAFIYSKIYYAIKFSKSKKKVLFLTFIYSYMIYCIFFHPFDSYFYLEFFCKSGFANIAVFVFVYYFIVYGCSKLQKMLGRKEC